MAAGVPGEEVEVGQVELVDQVGQAPRVFVTPVEHDDGAAPVADKAVEEGSPGVPLEGCGKGGDCNYLIANQCCYFRTREAACRAAGCADGRCGILKMVPQRVVGCARGGK